MTFEQVTEAMNSDSQDNYYILNHDHKYGNEVRLYKTYDSAYKAGVSIMRETASEWGEDVGGHTDFELWQSWTELSGETEFFSVEEIELNE